MSLLSVFLDFARRSAMSPKLASCGLGSLCEMPMKTSCTDLFDLADVSMKREPPISSAYARASAVLTSWGGGGVRGQRNEVGQPYPATFPHPLVFQVCFVTAQSDNDVLGTQLLELLDPTFKSIKRRSLGNVVNNDCCCCPAVIHRCE